jgi:hypothetical protein
MERLGWLIPSVFGQPANDLYRGDSLSDLEPAATTASGAIAVTNGDTLAIQVSSAYYPIWGAAEVRGRLR